jgi:hypothetical protein
MRKLYEPFCWRGGIGNNFLQNSLSKPPHSNNKLSSKPESIKESNWDLDPWAFFPAAPPPDLG